MSTNDDNPIEVSVDGSRSLRITFRESSPEESIAALRECFEDGLEKLTERERAIAEMRFGLSDGKHHPFEEIMETFDIAKDEIKRIDKKLFRLCKNPPHFQRKTKLRNFLD